MNHILVIDDEASIRTTLKILLENESYEVDEAPSLNVARECLNKNIYDVIVTDLRLDDGEGTEILETVKSSHLKSKVIVLTAYGSIKSAVEAMKLGAFEYVTKPIDSEQFLMTVSKAIEHSRLIGQIKVFRKEFSQKYNFQNILGKSKGMRDVLDVVQRIAETDVSVLIHGESGTGKEIMAKAIHNNSLRSDGPLVIINCSGINEYLLESELFGHIKGSFTGAISNRTGMMEDADGGTLFLDEVGTMPMSIQPKLLRALQDKTIQRLGSNKSLKIDCRFISASNRNLNDLVKEGGFRDDLYYRMRVVELYLPPLRERREDIYLLAESFLHKFQKKMNRLIDGFSREVIDFFLSYSWPGNVRELEHCVESAVALCKSELIQMEDLPKSIVDEDTGLLQNARAKKLTLHDFEREYILETLKDNDWNQKKTAELLGIGRNTLWRKIKEYNFTIPVLEEDER